MLTVILKFLEVTHLLCHLCPICSRRGRGRIWQTVEQLYQSQQNLASDPRGLPLHRSKCPIPPCLISHLCHVFYPRTFRSPCQHLFWRPSGSSSRKFVNFTHDVLGTGKAFSVSLYCARVHTSFLSDEAPLSVMQPKRY